MPKICTMQDIWSGFPLYWIPNSFCQEPHGGWPHNVLAKNEPTHMCLEKTSTVRIGDDKKKKQVFADSEAVLG